MKERNSNIELLRIISMAMVLMVHFVGGAFGLPSEKDMQSPDTNMLAKTVLESFAIIGVNCFVLISGYFGIRFSIKGLAKYTLICLFASLFVFAAQSVIEDNFDFDLFTQSLRIFSDTDLWFVPAYLVLFILSPVLNSGLECLRGKTYILFFIGLTFVNVYLGWFCSGSVNPYGYNVMQMIYLYAIGNLLNRYSETLQQIPSNKWMLVYLAFTALIVLTAFYMPFRKAYAYNSPFVLLSAVSFFMFFAVRKSFSNSLINTIASASFMVYLLHKSPFMWLKLKNALISFYADYDCLTFITVCVLLFIAVYIVSVIIGVAFGKILRSVGL